MLQEEVGSQSNSNQMLSHSTRLSIFVFFLFFCFILSLVECHLSSDEI